MSYITKKRFFYINSANRVSGTDSNFIYNLNYPHDEDYNRAVILQASIPISYYTVESGYNSFTLQEGTSSVLISIPAGNYNQVSLQTVLQTQLNTLSPNHYVYAISFPNTQKQAQTGLYTFTVSGNGTTQPQFIFTTNLYQQLGFNENSTNSFTNNSLISTNVIKLIGEDALFIHSDLVANGDDNIIQEIYVNGNPTYSVVQFQTPDIQGYAKLITTINSVYNFYLTDEFNNPIELNGQNCNFTLLLYKESPIFHMIIDYIKLLLYSQK